MEKKAWGTCEDTGVENLSSAVVCNERKNARPAFGNSCTASTHSFGHLTVDSLLQREPISENIYSEVISNARRYIHENFSRKISIDEIARHCCMSQYHFSRIFKVCISVAPHQYLLQLRLRHAEKLIKYTDLPITDICFMSGFSSLDYFSTAFAKKYKRSPTKFRMLQQAELR